MRTLLGALLRESAIPETLRTRLAVHDFSPQHRLLASAVLAAFENHGTCDILTTGSELSRLGGGITETDQLLGLAESAPIGMDFAHLYKLVIEKNGDRSTVDATVGVDAFLLTPPVLEMDVEGMRVHGDHGWTVAAPKAMKGLFSLEEARACSTGTPFLGHFATKKRRVLYLSEEDRIERLHRRVHAMVSGRAPEEIPAAEDLRFLVKAGVRLDTKDGRQILHAHLARWKPDLVFLEHFDKLHSRDANKAADVKPLLDVLDQFHANFHCTFRIQKHMRKEGPGQGRRKGEMIAGSVAQFGWGESNVYLTLLKRGLAQVETEAKDGDMAPRFLARYDGGRVVYAGEVQGDRKEQRQAEILDLIEANPGITIMTISTKVGLGERQVRTYLKALKEAGLVVCNQETAKQSAQWCLKGLEEKDSLP